MSQRILVYIRTKHKQIILLAQQLTVSLSRKVCIYIYFFPGSSGSGDADMRFVPYNQISRKFSHLANSRASPILITSSIRTLVQQGDYTQALELYSKKSPLNASKFIFPSLIRACASLSNLLYGKTIHSTIIVMGLQDDPYIGTSLINMYVKCGSLGFAVKVFDKMCECEDSVQDVTIWNSVIDGYFRFGRVNEGVTQLFQMQLLGRKPDGYSLCILLGVCGDGILDSMEGKQIHGYILRNGLNGDPFLDTALIDMYLRFGRVVDAQRAFFMVGDKGNVVAWNVMIGGFCNNGLWECSLEFYLLAKVENVKLVSTSLTGALSACCQGESVDFGRQVHCDMVKMGFENDSYVCTSLLTMYAKCKLVEEAGKVFSRIPVKGIELWNSIISGYAWNGYGYNALEVYHQMRLNEICSDSFTLSNVLSVCSMLGLCDYGKSVHAELLKRPTQINATVQSALLTMYCKFGSDADASLVFSEMQERDTIAWGSMISGFCQNKKFEEALGSFLSMRNDNVKPDSDIMATVINASTGLETLDFGSQVHAYVVKNGLEIDVFVASSLIDLYSKCGVPEMAEKVFSCMPNESLVAWNAMISCYCRNSLPDMSIRIFHQILEHGLCPDQVSITSVLAAISSLAALLKGKSIHGYMIRFDVPSDTQVQNSLIDMYMKCGILMYALIIFRNMPHKTVITWNLMISGYGSHGDCLGSLGLFEEMRSTGFKPDEVTFLSLISACNHSGFVEEGHKLFKCMTDEYHIEPKMDHYVNLVDLLGRAGRLEDAFGFLETMPMEPDRSIWLCLLSASRAHCDVELGEIAAHKLMEKEPSRGSNYVQLINLYVEGGLWHKAAEVRALMKEKGLKKSPGCSWIEVKAEVDVFFSGDSSFSRAVEVYDTLNNLRRNMQKKGWCELEGSLNW